MNGGKQDGRAPQRGSGIAIPLDARVKDAAEKTFFSDGRDDDREKNQVGAAETRRRFLESFNGFFIGRGFVAKPFNGLSAEAVHFLAHEREKDGDDDAPENRRPERTILEAK